MTTNVVTSNHQKTPRTTDGGTCNAAAGPPVCVVVGTRLTSVGVCEMKVTVAYEHAALGTRSAGDVVVAVPRHTGVGPVRVDVEHCLRNGTAPHVDTFVLPPVGGQGETQPALTASHPFETKAGVAWSTRCVTVQHGHARSRETVTQLRLSRHAGGAQDAEPEPEPEPDTDPCYAGCGARTDGTHMLCGGWTCAGSPGAAWLRVRDGDGHGDVAAHYDHKNNKLFGPDPEMRCVIDYDPAPAVPWTAEAGAFVVTAVLDDGRAVEFTVPPDPAGQSTTMRPRSR